MAKQQRLNKNNRRLDEDTTFVNKKSKTDGKSKAHLSREESFFEGSKKLLVWRREWLLILVLLVICSSFNTLSNGFAYDDDTQVLKNDFIRNISDLPLAFTHSVWAFISEDLAMMADAYYRPLFTSLFAINYALFGTTAWGWHLVNVLIHAAVTLLIFFVIREISERHWLAFLTAAMFAVHPSHVESVAWISGITDPLMALFVLPAFYFYLRYRKRPNKYYLVGIAAFYFLAMLSKETAIVLPAIFFLSDLFILGDSFSLQKRVLRAVSMAVLFVLPTGIYLLMRVNALGHFVVSQTRFDTVYMLSVVPLAILKYLKLLAIPADYSIIHQIVGGASFLKLDFILPLLLIVVLLVGIYISKSRLLCFAAVWFILWLVPPLIGLRAFETQFAVQERYLYLPSIGFFLMLSLAVEWLAQKRVFKVSGLALASAFTISLLILWSVVSIEQNRVWNSSLDMLRHSMIVNEDTPIAYTEFAERLYREGQKNEAEEKVRQALNLDENFLDAHLLSSQFAFNKGQTDKALEILLHAKSLEIEETRKLKYWGRIDYDLGFIYEQRKEYDLAEDAYSRALENTPLLKYLDKVGDFYFNRGRYEEALQMYNRVLTSVPSWFAPIYFKIARCYDQMGERERAKEGYKKYLALASIKSIYLENAMRRLSQL